MPLTERDDAKGGKGYTVENATFLRRASEFLDKPDNHQTLTFACAVLPIVDHLFRFCERVDAVTDRDRTVSPLLYKFLLKGSGNPVLRACRDLSALLCEHGDLVRLQKLWWNDYRYRVSQAQPAQQVTWWIEWSIESVRMCLHQLAQLTHRLIVPFGGVHINGPSAMAHACGQGSAAHRRAALQLVSCPNCCCDASMRKIKRLARGKPEALINGDLAECLSLPCENGGQGKIMNMASERDHALRRQAGLTKNKRSILTECTAADPSADAPSEIALVLPAQRTAPGQSQHSRSYAAGIVHGIAAKMTTHLGPKT